MDANSWVLIIGAIFLGVAKIVSMVLDYLRAKDVAAKVEMVANVAKEVAKETAVKTDVIVDRLDTNAKVGIATHTLVNNKLAVELKDNWDLKEWKAQRTKDDADLRAAELAKQRYEEHMVKQADVDAVILEQKDKQEA